MKLEATSSEPGCILRAPAANVGMVPLCKDTFFGKLRLQMWERTEKGDQGRVCFPFLSCYICITTQSLFYFACMYPGGSNLSSLDVLWIQIIRMFM